MIRTDGTTNVEIRANEEYTISAEDIAVLLNIVNDCNTKTVRKLSWDNGIFTTTTIISNEDLISELNDLNRKIREEIEYARKNSDKYLKSFMDLEKKIKDFNEDRKIFWRPIKIE